MSEEREVSKGQIRDRLAGFVPNVVRSDVDSVIFDDATLLKINELAEIFPTALIIEVMHEDYHDGKFDFTPGNAANQDIEAIQKLISDRQPDILLQIAPLYSAIRKMFETLVVPDPDPAKRLIKDPDTWIRTVNLLKEEYDTDLYTVVYASVYVMYDLMWSENLTRAQAQLRIAQARVIASQINTPLNPPFDGETRHYFSQQPGEPNFWADELPNFRSIELQPLIPPKSSLGRSLRIQTNQSSGGYGHDITTNGGGHKKVVTGKAGNKYPIAKRRGVR